MGKLRADEQCSPLRFVFVCIRLVVLTASFVGACTARPSFYNSYSFAEADDQWSPLQGMGRRGGRPLSIPFYLLLLTCKRTLAFALRFVFVCIRLVVLAVSFVGACTARPSFCNSYSFAEADDQWSPLLCTEGQALQNEKGTRRARSFFFRTTNDRSSQATKHDGAFAGLTASCKVFQLVAGAKQSPRLFCLLPLRYTYPFPL